MAIVKVILETGYLSEDDIARGCALAVEAGARLREDVDRVSARAVRACETSRSCGPTVGPDIGVKAAGGIRDSRHRAGDARGRRDAAGHLGRQRDRRRGERARALARGQAQSHTRARRGSMRSRASRSCASSRTTRSGQYYSFSPATGVVYYPWVGLLARVPLQLHAAALRVSLRVRARQARAASARGLLPQAHAGAARALRGVGDALRPDASTPRCSRACASFCVVLSRTSSSNPHFEGRMWYLYVLWLALMVLGLARLER